MAYSDCGWTCGCAGKTVKSLENTRHTWALLRWWFTTKRCYIKCMDLYLYLSQFYLHTLAFHLQLEWAIPAFAFPAVTGTHLLLLTIYMLCLHFMRINILIYRPRRVERLSRPWCKVARAEIRLATSQLQVWHSSTQPLKMPQQIVWSSVESSWAGNGVRYSRSSSREILKRRVKKKKFHLKVS